LVNLIKLMDYKVIIGNVCWQILRLFTICSMYCRDTYDTYLRDYFQGGSDTDEINYPFYVVEKDGLFKIIYPIFEKADFNFIQVQIEQHGEKHEVNLDPYMVVGNRILDKEFVSYILYVEKNILLDEDEEYKVHVMDQNVEMFYLTEKDYIEINKDNYLKKCLDE